MSNEFDGMVVRKRFCFLMVCLCLLGSFSLLGAWNYLDIQKPSKPIYSLTGVAKFPAIAASSYFTYKNDSNDKKALDSKLKFKAIESVTEFVNELSLLVRDPLLGVASGVILFDLVRMIRYLSKYSKNRKKNKKLDENTKNSKINNSKFSAKLKLTTSLLLGLIESVVPLLGQYCNDSRLLRFQCRQLSIVSKLLRYAICCDGNLGKVSALLLCAWNLILIFCLRSDRYIIRIGLIQRRIADGEDLMDVYRFGVEEDFREDESRVRTRI